MNYVLKEIDENLYFTGKIFKVQSETYAVTACIANAKTYKSRNVAMKVCKRLNITVVNTFEVVENR